MWRLLRRLREPWEGRFVTYSQVSRGLVLPWSLQPGGAQQTATAQREHQQTLRARTSGDDGEQQHGGEGEKSRREQDEELLDAVQDKGNLMLEVNLEQLRIGFRTAFDTLINAINTQALADDSMVSPRLGCFLDDWRRAYIMRGVLPTLKVEEGPEPEIVRLRIKRGSCDRRNKVLFGLFSPDEVRQHLMEGALGPEYQLASTMHQHGPQRLVATVAFPHTYSWTYTPSHHHPSLVRQLAREGPKAAQVQDGGTGDVRGEGHDSSAPMSRKQAADKRRRDTQGQRDDNSATPAACDGDGGGGRGGLLSWLLAPVGSGRKKDGRESGSTAASISDSNRGGRGASSSDPEHTAGQQQHSRRQGHGGARETGCDIGALPPEVSHEHIVHEWEFEAEIVGKEVVGWQVRNINSVIYPV